MREVAGPRAARCCWHPDAREGVERARAVVDELVANNQLSYAITTGVGKLSDVRIAGDQIRELQVNLFAHTPSALANLFQSRNSRHDAAAREFAFQRLLGRSRHLIDKICEMLNRGVTPFVPSQGSVGASGDLAPLAHLALVLIGEGECLEQEVSAFPQPTR